MTRLFLSEYVCGGGWPDGCPDEALRAEGRAMLVALATDFARLSDFHVTTTWDPRQGTFPVPSVTVVPVHDRFEEETRFRELAGACDGVVVIAPEFHDILGQRCDWAQEAGGVVWGPSPEIVRLCGDKQALAERLRAAGVRVVPTFSFIEEDPPPSDSFPIVVKPRHGAGSVNTFLIHAPEDWPSLRDAGFDAPDLPPTIWQPWIAGRAMSAGALVRFRADATAQVDCFPPGMQTLSTDGRFRYQGGLLPAVDAPNTEIESLLRRCVEWLGPGCLGYLGFDLIVPDLTDEEPWLVEINPRLTTSYLAYRELANENLAARWNPSPAERPPIAWRNARVEFTPSRVTMRETGD